MQKCHFKSTNIYPMYWVSERHRNLALASCLWDAEQSTKYKNTHTVFFVLWDCFPLRFHTLVHLFLRCKRPELLMSISHSGGSMPGKYWIKVNLCRCSIPCSLIAKAFVQLETYKNYHSCGAKHLNSRVSLIMRLRSVGIKD